MKAIVDKLAEAGRQWGFDVRKGRIFDSPAYQYFLGKRYPLAFIVNKDSLLFYFRGPLLQAVPDFGRLIRNTAINIDHMLPGGEYTVRITNREESESIIAFVDSEIVPRLGLVRLHDRSQSVVPIAIDPLPLAQDEELSVEAESSEPSNPLDNKVASAAQVTDPPLLRGSGFGDPEQNAEVERAAIKLSTEWYANQGWAVVSVESRRSGFDLLCTRDGAEEHVEVKGVSGNERRFVITAGELKQARRDDRFVLALVTNALSQAPTIERFTASRFLADFIFAPIQYWATESGMESVEP